MELPTTPPRRAREPLSERYEEGVTVCATSGRMRDIDSPRTVPLPSAAVSKVCSVCGKGPAFGHNRSHSMVATKRRLNPNLQRVRILVAGRRPARTSARAASRPARSRSRLATGLGAGASNPRRGGEPLSSRPRSGASRSRTRRSRRSSRGRPRVVRRRRDGARAPRSASCFAERPTRGIVVRAPTTVSHRPPRRRRVRPQPRRGRTAVRSRVAYEVEPPHRAARGRGRGAHRRRGRDDPPSLAP